jgi:hypothetical protein
MDWIYGKRPCKEEAESGECVYYYYLRERIQTEKTEEEKNIR